LRARHDGHTETFQAQAVVIATPAYCASHLVAALSPPLAQTLSGIAYAPVGVVTAGYYAKQVITPMDGFGLLIPRSEKHRTLGMVWNSSLFPDRAPTGQISVTSFVGGATDPEILEKPEKEILALVESENERILGLTGSPITSAVWKHPRALPQYNLGHSHVVRAIRDAEQVTPGLHFAGNYLEGPSIGRCVEQGFSAADAVRPSLAPTP
jgi:oxygen-dependent protoporphyrinogen oxidase